MRRRRGLTRPAGLVADPPGAVPRPGSGPDSGPGPGSGPGSDSGPGSGSRPGHASQQEPPPEPEPERGSELESERGARVGSAPGSPPPAASQPSSRVRRPHLAARVEDAVNRLLVRVLRSRDWLPSAFVYDGYGSAPGTPGPYEQGWVRVLGRVVMGRPDERTRSSPPRGWRSFLTAQVEHAPVHVSVGGSSFELAADRSGVVDVVLQVDLEPGWHDVVVTPQGGTPSHGAVVVVGQDTAHGLVSDIDDTVIVTHLPRPLIAGWNTFVLRETARTEVPGMSGLLRTVADQHRGTLVVYLSTGAWNTAPFLSRFLARHRFPRGPLLLTDWGPTNTGWFRSGREHKLATMRRLQAEFPAVRWLLVGDDGQHDPDLYSTIARENPQAVRAIALRRLTATEQVLARGLAEPPSVLAGVEVPVVSAPDGGGLERELRDAGLA